MIKGEGGRKKTRLVAQGYNQKKCIDFTEIFAPITRLEAIRIMLAFSTYKNIKFFQMNVKSAFLNGFIEEEMYVRQPPSFEAKDEEGAIPLHDACAGGSLILKSHSIIFIWG